ncbi:MAG: 3-keto-5-aminohexanoate cleavage protein, partial [Acidimicrobiia bacterium]
MERLIIEVGLNEGAMKDEVSSVPWSPKEIAEDVLACADAGAAIVHFHARDPETGANRMDDLDSYRESMTEVRARGCDVLMYPTYPPYETEVERRFRHVLALADDPELAMEIGPLDMGSFNLIQFIGGRFSETTYLPLEYSIYANPFGHLRLMLDEYGRRGMIPSLAVFEPGHLRTSAAFLASSGGRGPADPRPTLKFFLSEQWLHGPLPDRHGLDAYLHMLEGLGMAGTVEWFCVPYAVTDPETVATLVEAAVAAGGHVRVGVGDNPRAAAGRTNAE